MAIDATDYNAALDRYRHLFSPEQDVSTLCREKHFSALGSRTSEAEQALIRRICCLPDGPDTLRRALLTQLYTVHSEGYHNPAHAARLYYGASIGDPFAALKLGVSHNHGHDVFHQDLIAARMYLQIAAEKGTPDCQEIARRELMVQTADYGNLRYGLNHQGDFQVSFFDVEKFTGEERDTVIVPARIRRICAGAFKNRKQIRHIILPESVRVIEQGAFQGCTALESIYLPHKLTFIAVSAFSGCKNLKQIRLSSALFHIGDFAFDGCSSLETVTIPGNVKTVGAYAFYNAGIRHLRLEDGVRRLESHCFSGCPIETFEATDSLETIHRKAFSDEKANLIRRYQPETWKVPEDPAPAEEQELLRYLLQADNLGPKLRQALLDAAYTGSPALLRFGADLGCSTAAWILGHSYASGLHGLTATAKTARKYLSAAKNHDCAQRELQILSDSTALSLLPKNWTLHKDGTLVIHNGVRQIEARQFRNNPQIKQVLLPRSLKIIDKAAFEGCANLEKVFLQSGLTEIRKRAFRNCYALSEISFPESLRKLGEEAFQGCVRLQKIDIPGSVDTVEDRCFLSSGLKEVWLDYGVRALGYSAFDRCPLEYFDFTITLLNVEKDSVSGNSLKRFCLYFDTCISLYKWSHNRDKLKNIRARCIFDDISNQFHTGNEHQVLYTMDGLPSREGDFGYETEEPLHNDYYPILF